MTNPTLNQIHEVLHRLRTLEVDLFEKKKERLISEVDFNSRLDKLKVAFSRIEKIKKQISTKTMNTVTPSHIDLPMMHDYSRIEQKIISQYVSDTKNYVLELAQKSKIAADWSIQAAEGRRQLWRSIWRLSWLRRQLKRLDQDMANVKNARDVVENFISKTEISGNEPNGKLNQKDLLAAFQEFEVVTSRVTLLRATLSSEHAKNEEMRNWLQGYSKNRIEKRQELLPPEPSIVAATTQHITDKLTGGARLAMDRLVVAKQLASAMTLHGAFQARKATESSSVDPVKMIAKGSAKKVKNSMLEDQPNQPVVKKRRKSATKAEVQK